MDKDDEHKQSPRKRSGRKTSPRASAGKPRKASAGKTVEPSHGGQIFGESRRAKLRVAAAQIIADECSVWPHPS